MCFYLGLIMRSPNPFFFFGFVKNEFLSSFLSLVHFSQHHIVSVCYGCKNNPDYTWTLALMYLTSKYHFSLLELMRITSSF